ncbi:MAG: hypothetical protein ABH845_05745 [Candidatus Omnitrophota bacterium]
MNILFEYATRLTYSLPVFGRRFDGIIRKLAIIFPCILVGYSVFAGNMRAEDLNGRSMAQQIVFDERVNIRPVVVPVMLREGNLTKSGGEGGNEIRASDSSRNPVACKSGREVSDQSADSGGYTGGYKGNDPIARAFYGHPILLHIVASAVGCLLGVAFIWWILPLVFEGRDSVPWPFNPKT